MSPSRSTSSASRSLTSRPRRVTSCTCCATVSSRHTFTWYRIDRSSGVGIRQVLLAQYGRDQLPPAAHAGLLEDRLDVVLHGVGRDLELLGDRPRGASMKHEPADHPLAFGETV